MLQYTSNIISMYCLDPSPNPGTPRLKFVVSSCQNRFNPSRTTQRVLTNGSILIHGLCQTFCCPQDQHRSLYMNASPRPMLQSISSHTGIWPWKSQRIPQTCSTEKKHSKTRLRYKIQTKKHLTSKTQNNYIILYSAMLGIILQRTIRLLSLERSSNIDHFCGTIIPICGMWISQQHPSQATHDQQSLQD